MLIKMNRRSDWYPRQSRVRTCTGCGKKVYHYDFLQFYRQSLGFKSEILQMYLVILCAPELSMVYFHRRSPAQPTDNLVCP